MAAEGVTSKFWGSGESDEEDSIEEASVGEEEEEEGPTTRGSRWLTRGVLSSDEEGDMPEKRRVRTAVEKALDDFHDTLSDIREHTSTIDVNAVNLALVDLDHLQKVSYLSLPPPSNKNNNSSLLLERAVLLLCRHTREQVEWD